MLIFLILYGLISVCWQKPNSKASDESARLQIWELEVRITLKGGGKQEQKKNTSRKEGKQSEIKFDLTLNLKTDCYLKWDFAALWKKKGCHVYE